MNIPTKTDIRQAIKLLRKNSSTKTNDLGSNQICQKIENFSIYKQAQHIGLYHASHGEVNLANLFSALSFENKIAYYPRMNADHTLTFLLVNKETTFIRNTLGIFEPQLPHEVSIQPFMLDLLLVPVVAFDANGSRLGRGGGYYDRSIANKRPRCLVGVAYDYQYYDVIPNNHQDISLDMVVTEKNVYCMSLNQVNHSYHNS